MDEHIWISVAVKVYTAAFVPVSPRLLATVFSSVDLFSGTALASRHHFYSEIIRFNPICKQMYKFISYNIVRIHKESDRLICPMKYTKYYN